MVDRVGIPSDFAVDSNTPLVEVDQDKSLPRDVDSFAEPERIAGRKSAQEQVAALMSVLAEVLGRLDIPSDLLVA